MNYVLGQESVLDIDIPKIVINMSGECSYLSETRYNEKSDTTHYYLTFESYFDNDSLQVFCNDSIVYCGTITTDYSLGVAKCVKIGCVNTVKSLNFRINQDPIIEIYPIKGRYYMSVNRLLATIYICFSKYSCYYE